MALSLCARWVASWGARGSLCLALAIVTSLASPGRNQIFTPPSPIIALDIARDAHGLLWLATTDGVVRFDGLHYQPIAGCPFKKVRFVAVDPVGQVWAGGPDGLAQYNAGQWKSILRETVTAMALSSAGLWIDAAGLRLISLNGAAEKQFPQAKPTGELVVDTDGSLWFPCGVNICTMRAPAWQLESRPNPVPGAWKKILPDGTRRLWLSSPTAVALEENGVLRWQQKADQPYSDLGFPFPLDPFRFPGGAIWGTRNNLGQRPGLGTWQSSPIVDNCSYGTNETTRWFCAGERIGRSIRGDNWETWTGERFNYAAANGVLARKEKLPLAFTDHGVLGLDEKTSLWKRLSPSAIDDPLAMVEDGHGGYWLATRAEGLVRTDRDFKPLEQFPGVCASRDIRTLLRDNSGRVWVGGKTLHCFFQITGRPGQWKFQPQALPVNALQTVESHLAADGRPWIGYHYGLAYLDDSGTWQAIHTSEPVTMTRSFTFDGPDVIWVSHRKPGLFSRLERHTVQSKDVWQVRRFTSDRYGPADSWYMRRDSRGWIWRGTSTGVQAARPGHYEPADWLQLTVEKGLAANGQTLNGWAEDDAGDVWLAGNEGVTRLHPSAEWFQVPSQSAPLVTRVSVGDRISLGPDHLPEQFPLRRGAIEVDLSAMDANAFQASPLKYRLTPGNGAWTNSQDGRIKINAVSSGPYTLEAAYTGEGTPPLMRWNFRMTNPAAPLWTGWLAVLAALLLVLVWWRWTWLRYWATKPFFLLGRAVQADSETVSWTNYTGHTFIKRYRVLEPIARGGFAVAYLAEDLKANTKVVVKVLHRSPGQESWNRNRFAHEVAALHTVRHPGVVPLLDSWITAEGEPCLAMPFLAGPTLRHLLKEGPVPPVRAALLIQQMGSALAAIHEPGIVHRDFKPENIIVLFAGTSDERIVVIDFGTSASRGPQSDLEKTLTLTGSLHYLAPERLTNQYSTASDVYSLGVIILEMLTGKRPADFDATPSDSCFLQMLSPEVGPEVAAELVSALHPNPHLRPADVAHWAAGIALMLREFRRSASVGGPST